MDSQQKVTIHWIAFICQYVIIRSFRTILHVQNWSLLNWHNLRLRYFFNLLKTSTITCVYSLCGSYLPFIDRRNAQYTYAGTGSSQYYTKSSKPFSVLSLQIMFAFKQLCTGNNGMKLLLFFLSLSQSGRIERLN